MKITVCKRNFPLYGETTVIDGDIFKRGEEKYRVGRL